MGEKVVLVGHSYAGMVIGGAVESHPTKIQTLIFLDAFIPEDGQCAMDLLPPSCLRLYKLPTVAPAALRVGERGDCAAAKIL